MQASLSITNIIALILTALGIFVLLPKRINLPRPLGWLLVVAGIVALCVSLIPDRALISNDALFFLFAASAMLCGVLMITSRNPIYGALWFAVTTLGVCGLFMLQSAPFLAAATLIVYAGAIIVTFLFVVMLAQQSGLSIYDQRTHQPLAATASAFVLLFALLTAINRAEFPLPVEGDTVAAVITNPHSQPTEDRPLESMQTLGRSLFGDYLFAVEIAGTLLLIASIGAILLSPRKEQVTL